MHYFISCSQKKCIILFHETLLEQKAGGPYTAVAGGHAEAVPETGWWEDLGQFR